MISEGMASPANAVIRIQLEVGARCNALFLVEDAEEICQHILSGRRIGDLKDKHGSKMSDNYLFQKFKEKRSGKWNYFLTRIQEVGCMHIHFSAAAAHRSITQTDLNNFALRDLGEDYFVTENERSTVIFAVQVATLQAATVIKEAYCRILQPKPED